MATPILDHLDGVKIAQLQNFLIQPLASSPSTPAQGQIYFDTTLGAFGCCTNATGPVWQYIPVTAAVLASLFDAQSTLVAVSDNTPIVAVVGTEGTIGRTAGVNSGNIGPLTWTQVRTALGALQGFTAPTGTISMGSQIVNSVGTPVAATDAATKGYVDATAQGLDWKEAVRVASTANLTVASPGTTIDGVTMAASDRVLLKNQTTGSENGIYTWVASGSPMTRTLDADVSAEVTAGLAVFVTEGTANADKGYLLTTNNPITLGTTALVFTQFSSSGGTGTVNKFAATIGDGSTTAIIVTHSLGTQDVALHAYDVASGLEVWCDKARTSTTTATFTFNTAPASNAIRVVCLG